MSSGPFGRDLRLRTRRGRLGVLAAVISAVIAFPRLSAGQDWTRVDLVDGIEISRRTAPGTGLVAMRGIGTIEAPVWKVASILLDPPRAPEWVDSLRESRVVQRLGP